jgi:hypothetical protein
MTKEERLKHLLGSQEKLKEYRNIYDIEKFYSFIVIETENEKYFIQDNEELKDSFMWSRLNAVKIKIERANECKRKNKMNDAYDLINTAIRNANNDYNFVIDLFRKKNEL